MSADGELAAAAVRVPFGPGDDDSVPLSWAASMLRQLAETKPKDFGKLLTAAALNGRGQA